MIFNIPCFPVMFYPWCLCCWWWWRTSHLSKKKLNIFFLSSFEKKLNIYIWCLQKRWSLEVMSRTEPEISLSACSFGFILTAFSFSFIGVGIEKLLSKRKMQGVFAYFETYSQTLLYKLWISLSAVLDIKDNCKVNKIKNRIFCPRPYGHSIMKPWELSKEWPNYGNKASYLGPWIPNWDPCSTRNVRSLEKVSQRLCKTKCSLLFNSFCVNESLLPNYTIMHHNIHPDGDQQVYILTLPLSAVVRRPNANSGKI